MKDLIGYTAVALTFIGYVPYIKDTLRRKTQPHVYTWFLWGFVTAIAYGLQVGADAGTGALVTLAAAAVCLFIAVVGFAMNGRRDVTKSDSIFFALSIVALLLWLFAKQPVVSVILLSTIDMLAFIPTIRKSWRKPFTETLFSYQLNTLRFALALFALDNYGIVAVLYPATWVVANGLFSTYLVQRRRAITAV